MTKREPHTFERPIDQAVLVDAPVIEQAAYTEVDVECWKVGAEKFRAFWQALPSGQKTLPGIPHEINRSSEARHNRGAFQAIFLGEKPAALMLTGHDDFNAQALQAAGLERTEKYIYRPDLVQTTMEKYPKDFAPVGAETPAAVMEALDKFPQGSELARGLILGFPRESVLAFVNPDILQIDTVIDNVFKLVQKNSADGDILYNYFGNRPPENHQPIIDWFVQYTLSHTEQLGIQTTDLPRLVDELRQKLSSKIVDIYGIVWADYKPSEESRRKQERLRAAFELSGILDVQD